MPDPIARLNKESGHLEPAIGDEMVTLLTLLLEVDRDRDAYHCVPKVLTSPSGRNSLSQVHSSSPTTRNLHFLLNPDTSLPVNTEVLCVSSRPHFPRAPEQAPPPSYHMEEMYLLPAIYMGCQGKGAGATLVNLQFKQPHRSDDVLPGSRVLVNPQDISLEIVDIIECAISSGDVSAPCEGAVDNSTAGIRAVLRPILGLWASAEGARWSVGLSDIALSLLDVILQFMESTDTNDLFELNLLVSRTRGACLRLLSNDIRVKPDKVSLGLSLLRVLVRCATGLGHGIWLGEALRLVSLISLMIRQQMKLVL